MLHDVDQMLELSAGTCVLRATHKTKGRNVFLAPEKAAVRHCGSKVRMSYLGKVEMSS